MPRTLALLLAGMALAVAGLIMQMLVRNRYVEPTTAGTVESATLGILVITLLAPDTPVIGKMLTATGFALAGTLLFLALLRRVPLRTPFIVPLIGLILGGVIHAVTTFVAYRFDLLQSLHAWTTGDFSGVLRGRYELLWIGFGLACAAYAAADRYTVAGMGREFASNLGLNHARLTLVGLLIVSAISAVVVVTAGGIPFLGLIVPNAVSLVLGRQHAPGDPVGGGAGRNIRADLRHHRAAGHPPVRDSDRDGGWRAGQHPVPVAAAHAEEPPWLNRRFPYPPGVPRRRGACCCWPAPRWPAPWPS